MYFQKVLKGLGGIDDAQARAMLLHGGILCNWWNRVGRISPRQVADKLTEANLFWHLERYDDTFPETGRPFREDTPFISTTAGAVERSTFFRTNLVHPPLLTALLFATDWFSRSGYVFYGYVYTLGRPAVPLREFAEEVRELHLYTSYLRFHPEGEITAKIEIPSARLGKVERYDGPTAEVDLRAGRLPTPVQTWTNPSYCRPEDYANIREALDWPTP